MADYGMRQTMCECGHIAVAHYDSYLFCTHTIDGDCDCQEFKAAGPEVYLTAKERARAALADVGVPE